VAELPPEPPCAPSIGVELLQPSAANRIIDEGSANRNPRGAMGTSWKENGKFERPQDTSPGKRGGRETERR
jgi:hypothetical protein